MRDCKREAAPSRRKGVQPCRCQDGEPEDATCAASCACILCSLVTTYHGTGRPTLTGLGVITR